jgi:cell division protein FtsL
MTFIKSTQDSGPINKILIALIGLLVITAVVLIIIYNRYVNLNHELSQIGDQINKIQTENAEFKEKIFAQFDDLRLTELATERGLVKDRNPEYIEVGPRNRNEVALGR